MRKMYEQFMDEHHDRLVLEQVLPWATLPCVVLQKKKILTCTSPVIRSDLRSRGSMELATLYTANIENAAYVL